MSRTAVSRLSKPFLNGHATAPCRGLPNATIQSPTATRRSFFTLPNGGSEPQTLTASKTLPYASKDLYTLIADVDSYSSFVPYCAQSRVTKWSTPDPSANSSDLRSRPWPSQADLRVGWGGFEETFTSKLRCDPGKSVEALSGEDAGPGATGGSVFKSLVTRWDVKPVDRHPQLTEVGLVIKFQFANPLYAAVSAAVSEKVAGIMIEAFEKRARRMLGTPKSSS